MSRVVRCVLSVLLFGGCVSLCVVRCSLSVVYCLMVVVCCWLLFALLSLVTCCLLFVLCVACRLLFGVCCGGVYRSGARCAVVVLSCVLFVVRCFVCVA